ERADVVRPRRRLAHRGAEGHGAVFGHRSKHDQLRSDDDRSEGVLAAVEDQHAALPAPGEERAASGVQVRRVRRRADVRPFGQAAGPLNFVVIGCITREGGGGAQGRGGSAPTYIITDTRAKPPAVYLLEGADPELMPHHVGHTLEIAGQVTPTGRGGMATLKV